MVVGRVDGVEALEPNPLIGAWRLVTYEAHAGDEVSYPLGEDASGYIMYTPDGYMSVLIMAAGRPNFESDDILGGTDEEKLEAARTFLSYGGRYEFLGDRVVHKIETASYPNRVGTEQTRFIQFKGDELLLTTPPMVIHGTSRSGRLRWERAVPRSR
ncbi:MAG: lipocalin-like domain-containing protein [Chloroflexi bacterium]|nr:lipocalin-like domain-containing protein [Chloroflexota bacterium]